MSCYLRAWLVFVVVVGLTHRLPAQDGPVGRPELVQPRTPRTRAELDRAEALKLYARGLTLERDNLLLEAAKTYERALELDPDSNAVRKTLAPLYLALDRIDDALALCKAVVDRDPADFETWFLLARQYRVLDKPQEAADALTRALAIEATKEHPDLRIQIALDLGNVLENLDKHAEAEAAYTAVTSLLESPEPLLELGFFSKEELVAQAAEAYERLGKMAVRAGHLDKAIAAFKKAQDKDSRRRLRLDFNLADVYLAQGKPDAALASLDNYLRTQPPDTEAYELKIKLLGQLGRANQVVASLQAHSTADPENVELKLLLAREHGKAGQVREAESIYHGLLQKTARADVYRGLFESFKRQGPAGGQLILTNLDQVIQAASDKPNQAPNPADQAVNAARVRAMLIVLREDTEMVKLLIGAARHQMPRGFNNPGLHHETRRFLAVMAARTRQLEDAEQLYRSCLEERAFGRRGEQELYGGLLKVLWQSHKYEAIIKVCQDGLTNAQNANRVMFHLDLARAYALFGQNDTAIEQANLAADLAGDWERLFTRRVRVSILAQAGRYDQAEAEALKLFKEFTEPDEVMEIRYALSQVYSLAKKHTQADEQLQQIIKDHPDEPTAYNDLGYTWADQNKNLDEAEKYIRRALELDRKQRTSGTRLDADSDRDNAAYIDSLGWVLFRKGKLQEAKTELEKASSLPEGADDPVVWDHLGDAYHRLGDAAKAKALWTKSLELMERTKRRKVDDRERDLRSKLKLLEQTPAQR